MIGSDRLPMPLTSPVTLRTGPQASCAVDHSFVSQCFQTAPRPRALVSLFPSDATLSPPQACDRAQRIRIEDPRMVAREANLFVVVLFLACHVMSCRVVSSHVWRSWKIRHFASSIAHSVEDRARPSSIGQEGRGISCRPQDSSVPGAQDMSSSKSVTVNVVRDTNDDRR